MSRTHVSAFLRLIAALGLGFGLLAGGTPVRADDDEGDPARVVVDGSTVDSTNTFGVSANADSAASDAAGGDENAAIAGYYQGLGSVRSRGLFEDTQRYVANVQALRGRFGG